jgi:hypothetical protein
VHEPETTRFRSAISFNTWYTVRVGALAKPWHCTFEDIWGRLKYGYMKVAEEFTEDGIGFTIFGVCSHGGISFGIVGGGSECHCEFRINTKDDLGLFIIRDLGLFAARVLGL